MKALIIGASGLVGSNFFRLFKERESFETIGTHLNNPTEETVYFNPNELSNHENFDFGRFQPKVIIHTGAMTHVDACEENPEHSYERTVESTKNVAKIASMLNAKLVYISSDYVFDGEDGPYDENARTNPLSIYGKHKLEAEQIVRKDTNNALILRVTNVYGDEHQGKNFVRRIIDAIKTNQKKELRLPHDQYATPVNALDIARAALRLINDDKKGIYNIAGTDYMNRVQLANKVLSYFPGHRLTITPVSTDEIKPPAIRPLQGGLKSMKFLEEYPDFVFTNVDDYINNVVLPRKRRAGVES